MIIEKIVFKNKNYEVIFDDGLSIFIVEDTLVKFGLFKNMEIDLELLSNIKFEDQKYRAVKISLKYLCNMRTEFEVRNKLRENEIDSSVIDSTIEYLNNMNYLDDFKYATYFTKDKLSINKYGKEKIKLKLIQKGISKDIITEVLNSSSSELEYNNLYDLAVKKYNSLSDDDKKYEKCVRFLLSRGYNYSMIKKVLRDINE